MSNSSSSYKQLKEDFVSGLTGGSVGEIAAVTAILPLGALVWSVLQARQSFFKPYTSIGYVVDYILNVGAPLLGITLYAGSPLILALLLLAPAVLAFAVPTDSGVARRKKARIPSTFKNEPSNTPAQAQLPTDLPPKSFVTVFRGSMLVITCLAILAVDFRIFPRRFAKVETWGTSLMDIGVGAFVYSAGLVGARPILKEQTAGRTTPLARRLLYSLRHSFPLLVLGVIRLLSVKGLDYAEHVTEYGVHWNFFFTLGLLPPFVALFQSALKLVPSYAVLALALGVAYQVVLDSTSLKAFILIAPRTDLLSMNREGIFSFWGYLAIFLAGQDAGMYVLPRSPDTRIGKLASSPRQALLLTLGFWSAVWMTLFFLVTDLRFGAGVQVSRRLANLPYILGVVSFNSVQLFTCCLVDTLCAPSVPPTADAKTEKEAYETATSRVLKAYNRNGLAVFLAANLLTGLVNLTVPTLDVGPVGSMGVLVAYSGVLTGLVLVLDSFDISVKL